MSLLLKKQVVAVALKKYGSEAQVNEEVRVSPVLVSPLYSVLPRL
jgi:hypothetical protein